MANITIKRYSGSAWEIHYPKTIISQVIDLSTVLANMQGDINGKASTSHALSTHSDVAATTPASGQVLKWNGSQWAPATDSNATYSVISQADIQNASHTTPGRLVTGQRIDQAIVNRLSGNFTAGLVTLSNTLRDNRLSVNQQVINVGADVIYFGNPNHYVTHEASRHLFTVGAGGLADFAIGDYTGKNRIQSYSSGAYDMNFLNSGNAFAKIKLGSLLVAEQIEFDVGTITGTTIQVNFIWSGLQNHSITGNTNYTGTALNKLAGRSLTIRVVNTTGLTRTLTFNSAWRFIGTKPVNIANNKIGILTLTCFGANEGDIVAAWAGEV